MTFHLTSVVGGQGIQFEVCGLLETRPSDNIGQGWDATKMETFVSVFRFCRASISPSTSASRRPLMALFPVIPKAIEKRFGGGLGARQEWLRDETLDSFSWTHSPTGSNLHCTCPHGSQSANLAFLWAFPHFVLGTSTLKRRNVNRCIRLRVADGFPEHVGIRKSFGSIGDRVSHCWGMGGLHRLDQVSPPIPRKTRQL